MGIRLVVLGAGQDGGSPQLGMRRGVGRPRSASSVAIVTDDTVLLLDASPDMRTQYQTLLPLIDQRVAAAPFDAIAITHGHMGHYAGLVHLGKEAAATTQLPLIAPPSVLDFLAANEPWRALFVDERVRGVPIEDEPIEIGDLTLWAIPVPHRAEFTTTVAYSVVYDGVPWVLYLPDIDAWEDWQEAEATIAAHRVCLLDATFGSHDEVPWRDLTAVPHPPVSDTIERFAHLTASRRIILTHLNHSNPLADPSSALARAAVSAGFHVASDGLVIESGSVRS